MTRDELKATLEQFPGVLRVAIEGDYRLVPTVVSQSFAGKNEAERQAAVWDHLHAGRQDHDLQNIEYVFVLAPEEDEATVPADGG